MGSGLSERFVLDATLLRERVRPNLELDNFRNLAFAALDIPR